MLKSVRDEELGSSARVRSSPNSNFSLSTVNPWEHDSRQICSTRMSLILAGQMGLKTMEDETKCAQALAELPSLKLINLQKDLTAKSKNLLQVKHGIANYSQEKETADILRLDIIDQRIKKIKELCTDFDSVLQNADVLIHRLQKPFVGDFLRINASHHRFARDVFAQFVPTLNDLSMHLDNITWTANNNFSPSQLESMVVEIQSLTASLQTSYHTLCQMRKGVESLSQHKTSSTALEESFPTDTTLGSPASSKSVSTVGNSRSSKHSTGSNRVT